MSKFCLFCNMDKRRILEESKYAYAVTDGYPVTEGHLLVIPKRHSTSFWELTPLELKDCLDLVKSMHYTVKIEMPDVTGFNIGVNIGVDSGQTITHTHIHLIPRRKGDIDNPRGGVRGVIPDRRIYYE